MILGAEVAVHRPDREIGRLRDVPHLDLLVVPFLEQSASGVDDPLPARGLVGGKFGGDREHLGLVLPQGWLTHSLTSRLSTLPLAVRGSGLVVKCQRVGTL